jgi:hypothetical protein
MTTNTDTINTEAITYFIQQVGAHEWQVRENHEKYGIPGGSGLVKTFRTKTQATASALYRIAHATK